MHVNEYTPLESFLQLAKRNTDIAYVVRYLGHMTQESPVGPPAALRAVPTMSLDSLIRRKV